MGSAGAETQVSRNVQSAVCTPLTQCCSSTHRLRGIERNRWSFVLFFFFFFFFFFSHSFVSALHRELTSLSSFVLILEPSGGEVLPEDFDIIEHNDTLRVVQPSALGVPVSARGESPQSPLLAPRPPVHKTSGNSSLTTSPRATSAPAATLSSISLPLASFSGSTTVAQPPSNSSVPSTYVASASVSIDLSTKDKGKRENGQVHDTCIEDMIVLRVLGFLVFLFSFFFFLDGLLDLVCWLVFSHRLYFLTTEEANGDEAMLTSDEELERRSVHSHHHANNSMVRLPTRLDLQEGGGETNLSAYVLGFYWLHEQQSLLPLVTNLRERGVGNQTIQKHAKRKVSSLEVGENKEHEQLDVALRKLAVQTPRTIACGHNTVSVVDTSGMLWVAGPAELPSACFGAGPNSLVMEELGAKLVRVDVPVPVRSVSCSSYFCVAEAESGDVYSWGINSNLCTSGINAEAITDKLQHKEMEPGGQLGRECHGIMDPLPGVVTRIRRCNSLSCGASHSLILYEGGKHLVGWGCNEENQLGLGSTLKFEAKPCDIPFRGKKQAFLCI
jgi:hypothetical protein